MVVLKSKVFTAALWADCWDKVRREVDGCDQGTVIFDEDNGIELDIPFGEILKDRRVLILGGDDLPEELDWLYGFSQDGYWIALKDVTSSGTSRSFPGGVHQTLSATRLLYSKDEFDPTKKVTGAVLEIGGLAEWLGSSPVIMENYFDGGFRGFSLKADLNNVENELLFEDNAYKIAVAHGVNTSGSPEAGYEVGHRCFLQIDFKKPKTLGDAELVALHATEFFSFCFGFYAELVDMEFKFENGAKAHCLMGLVKGKVPSRMDASHMVLPYRKIRNDISHVCGAWMDGGRELRTSVSLLVSLMTKDWFLPFDLKFIAAAQMLESLSRVGVSLESMTDEDYAACKKELDTAIDGIEDRHIAKMLKQRVRLGNNKGQRRLLDEFVARHREVACFFFGAPDDFIRSHVDLRNGITHREGTPPSSVENLYWHTEAVLLFAYCAVGEVLGLTAETMKRCIEDSSYRNMSVWKCRKMYPVRVDEPNAPN